MEIAEGLEHPGWAGVVLPIVLCVGSTFSPGTLRLILLIGAVLAATWTFSRTPFAKDHKWQKTTCACGCFLVLAVGIFFVGRHYDSHSDIMPAIAIKNPGPQTTKAQSQLSSVSSQIPASPVTPKKKTKKHLTETVQPLPAIAPNGRGNAASPPTTYSVQSPTNSIVNQGNTVNGNQTINVNEDRQLTKDGADKLRTSLAGSRGVVYFSCVGGSAEEMNLAMQLAPAVSSADGWVGRLGSADVILGRPVHGIEVNAPQGQEDAARSLIAALNAAGLSAYLSSTFHGDSSVPADAITAYVGYKQ